MGHSAGLQCSCAIAAHVKAHSVKSATSVVGSLVAQLLQACFQDGSETYHTVGNAFQAFWTMVYRVHAGNHCWQHLRGTDVRRGFFAADVLLAGLQRQAVGRVAVAVYADTHQAARHAAFEFVAASQIARVGATGAHRHTKALGGTNHNVGTHFAWGFQHGQRQQVGGQNQGSVFGVDGVSRGAPIHQPAAAGRVLGDGGEIVISCDSSLPCFSAADNIQCQTQRSSTGLQDFNRLWVDIPRNNQYIAFGLDRALSQCHSFRSRSGLVQHRRVGNRHGGQVRDHGLEVHQGFHTALADFGLVRGVGGVPSGVFQNIAQNHARNMGVVIALADKAFQDFVFSSNSLELFQSSGFGNSRGQVHSLSARNIGGHDRADQGIAAGLAYYRQHVLFVLGRHANMARDEFRMVFERGQGSHGSEIDARKTKGAVLRQPPNTVQLGVSHQSIVSRLVQQLVQLSGVAQLHFEEPARIGGVGVG